MMSVRNVYYHRITRGQPELIGIPIVFLSSSFEFNFNNIKFIYFWNAHMGQPVERIHFIAITRTTSTIVLAASCSGSGRAAITSCHSLYIFSGGPPPYDGSVSHLCIIIAQNILSDILAVIMPVPTDLVYPIIGSGNSLLYINTFTRYPQHAAPIGQRMADLVRLGPRME